MEIYMTNSLMADTQTDATFAREVIYAVLKYREDDWGDLTEDDIYLNAMAKKYGGRILAAYNTSRGRIYIITDDTKAKKPVTTVLYASEY